MASFDGPKTTGGGGRSLLTLPPVIRLWSGATLERVCAFDPARNSPRLPQGPLWRRVDEAPTVEGSTGVRWPQVLGLRLHLRIDFVIYGPRFGPAPVSMPRHDGFTETDWQAVTSAMHRTRSIEVLPHGPQGSGQDARYLCELVDYGTSRPVHYGAAACYLEFEGLNVVTGLAPVEL